MRNIYVEDYRRTYVGDTLRVDMLVKVSGEYQHHYITMDRCATQYEISNYINDYVARNVRFRNYSDEQQALEKRAFKGGVR